MFRLRLPDPLDRLVLYYLLVLLYLIHLFHQLVLSNQLDLLVLSHPLGLFHQYVQLVLMVLCVRLAQFVHYLLSYL